MPNQTTEKNQTNGDRPLAYIEHVLSTRIKPTGFNADGQIFLPAKKGHLTNIRFKDGWQGERCNGDLMLLQNAVSMSFRCFLKNYPL